MAIQEMNFFEKEIEDPREIRNVSEEVLERAEELENRQELYVGLDHNHYSIVRGRNEASRGIDSKTDLDVDYPLEIHRNDAGNSWVHSPESKCFEKVNRIDLDQSKSHEEIMRRWAAELTDSIERYAESENIEGLVPEYDCGDIYNAVTGRQIGGLSLEIHGGRVLQRLCFYEDNHLNEDGEPDMEEHSAFHKLIEADLDAAEEDLDDPRQNYEPMPGLYEHLMNDYTKGQPRNLGISGELSKGEEVDDPRPATYCISRQPS